MARTTNLKKVCVSLLAASAFMLVSCDTVEAGLTDSEENAKILNYDGELTNNKMGEIYDALVTAGSSNSERVLNNILKIYAEKIFGGFYELREAVADDTAMTTFLANKAHQEVYGTDDNAAAKVKVQYNHWLESIKESFWGYVNNSTYQERSMFFEEKFYDAQINELYSLGSVTTFKSFELDAMKDEDDVASFFSPYDGTEGYLTTYKDYIERNLLPSLYRDALTEQYLIDNNLGSLGRSYARKVTYIALPALETDAATQKLLNAYCERVIEDATVDEKYSDFRYLNALYNGYWDFTDATWETLAAKIYSDAGFDDTVTDPNAKEIPVETAYGKLIKDYNEVEDNRHMTGTSTDFTGGNKYTKEVGLEIKTREIKATSKVKAGWFTSSGLSDLPSTIKNRVFKMSVANEVDSLEEGSFGKYVNGNYYMVPDEYSSDIKYPYAIFDQSSTTSYLVRVDEAVKAPKLVLDKETGVQSYQNMVEGTNARHTRDFEYQWDIIHNVAELLSSTDSYKKAAKQTYVKAMALEYHDQTVYDYFVSTFPDLFD
ncbi:MAG: hypothetical protein K6F32_03580 [Bacilli bacterium]|nr:hypothetical protein [Bacilli bacterium]